MRFILASILIMTAFSSPLSAAPLTFAQQWQARQLLTALGCQACHDLNKSGSTLAGSLENIGFKLNAVQIQALLQRPANEVGRDKNFMPSYQTTAPDQLELLSRFLADRK